MAPIVLAGTLPRKNLKLVVVLGLVFISSGLWLQTILFSK